MNERWLDTLEDRARMVLPAPVWRYFSAGARDEVTLGEATAAWSERRFAPHVLRDVSRVDTSTTLLGVRYEAPIGIAPTSMQRAAHPDGERAMLAGAEGAPVVVSSNCGFAFADLQTTGWWLQVYLPPDRPSMVPLLEAAQAAGATALVLTADTPAPGLKYGLSEDDWSGVDLSWHRRNLPSQEPPYWADDLGPADVGWLAATSGLPVVVKGVLRADDARVLVDAGASAIWVSNHGGRQLDRALPTARALPDVATAIAERAEVYVDGGIRSGLDIEMATALGARAAFVGRPALYALAAEGSDGVRRLLAELRAELVEGMRLAGCATLEETAAVVVPRVTSAP